jgi:signal transduction histidine kinase
MKVWRAEVTAWAPGKSNWVEILDFAARCSAPVLLLLVCLFVAAQVVTSENLVLKIGDARRIETELSTTFISVHTIKSRELEYLLTGSDRYLTHVDRDRARVSANFADLRRQLARDPEQFPRLVRFQAQAEDLLGTTSQAVADFQAGDAEGVREWLSSAAFMRLMSDNSIGSGDLVDTERARIAAFQDKRAGAVTRALMGVFALVLGLAIYAGFRIVLMASYLGRQKLTLRALERAKQAAEEARAAAEAANRAKTDFLASVSHELRTPLNAILGFSELLGFQMLGPLGHARYGEYAADIHRSGRHLLELVNDILDLSKVIAGKAELRESEFPVRALIADCVAPDLPLLHADFRMIKQILLNLLSNAAKFTPGGGRIQVAAAWVKGDGLVISVSDTGIGMSPADIEKALLPFGQIDSRIARRHEGAGLGLPIARAHAELHGGRLIVESAAGQGTKVTLALPESRLRAAVLRLAS